MKRAVLLLSLSLVVGAVTGSSGQVYSSGQDVVPVFEGWEQTRGGTFDLVFGYMNRNREQELYIPVGPDNNLDFTPSGDAGQPTHFYARRQKYVFKVTVPKDWGKKDVVWTLKANGKTEKAYGSLLPVEIIDDQVYSMNRSGGGAPDRPNLPPTLKVLNPDQLTASMGAPVTLTVAVSDDGVPSPRPAPSSRPPGRHNALGLRTTWIHYRGPGTVTFDPWISLGYDDHVVGWTVPKLPPDGRVVTQAMFSEPGTYVLRAIADDGYLFTVHDVTVTVTGGTTGEHAGR
jgi:hypothetical protein